MAKKQSKKMGLKIGAVAMGKINPAKYNPREADDESLELLKASIKEDGYVEPMVWNEKTGNLISGHQRLKVLKDLGVKTVDVSIVNVSVLREKRLNLRLNKQAGHWSNSKLAEIMIELGEEDMDMGLTGFTVEEVDDISIHSEGSGQKRPEFSGIIDEFEATNKNKSKKDQNWFYVEYFGQNKRFKEVTELLKDMMKGKHEIDGVKFYKLVTGAKK